MRTYHWFGVIGLVLMTCGAMMNSVGMQVVGGASWGAFLGYIVGINAGMKKVVDHVSGGE